jgi:2-amino-4-hydroxy-6-hydroxymethyldihydropteridine diphosphokinase
LGSNLGDRLENIQTAVNLLHLTPIAKAPIFESAPVDCAPGDPGFYNTVIIVSFEGPPEELLACTQAVEKEMGRPLERLPNSPRPIDLDLLYFGQSAFVSAYLTLPHPRIFERRFVLEPLAQLRPDLILPGCSKTLADELIDLQSSEPKLQLVTKEW